MNKMHSGAVIDSVGDVNVIECGTCGFRHTDPLPNQEETDELYRDVHYDDGCLDRIDYYERDRKWWMISYGDVLEEISSATQKDPGRLLDIGCGAGIFMEAAIERGWEVDGVEPSKIAASHCRDKGLKIIEQCFDDELAENVEKADVIHMRNVLEHVSNPAGLVSSASKALKPGGLIVVAVPNDYNPLQSALRKEESYRPWWLAVKHHLNYFNFATLEGLVKGQGFKVAGRFSSFPIDLFLTMGENYIEEPSKGRECHLKRVRFEELMENAGSPEVRRDLYRSFARAGLGREAFVLAKKSK